MKLDTRLAFIISLLLVSAFMVQACSNQPMITDNNSSSTTSSSRTANLQQTSTLSPTVTCVPGDFTLQSIIEAAEQHMPCLTFTDISADELKELYPGVATLPVEVRGRRAEDGTEYLVLAAADAQDLSKIPDIQSVLEGAAETRATALSAESKVVAGGFNKYGAIVCAKKDANELVGTICNTFTGYYIGNPPDITGHTVMPNPSPIIPATATPDPSASGSLETITPSTPA